jgi:uncharacterized protein YcbK (DUF882 family)
MLPDEDFMALVEKLRQLVGFPLKVSSAARCPSHNQAVSATGRSGPHTTGRAIDFAVSHGQAVAVISAALQLKITGIGVQQKGSGRFIHLDDLPNAAGQPRPTVWSY